MYFAPFCGYIKLNVVIMDKKSNKANYFWNSYQNALLESGIPELRHRLRNAPLPLSFWLMRDSS